MKLSLLTLASLGSAFVIPQDLSVFDISQDSRPSPQDAKDLYPVPDVASVDHALDVESFVVEDSEIPSDVFEYFSESLKSYRQFAFIDDADLGLEEEGFDGGKDLDFELWDDDVSFLGHKPPMPSHGHHHHPCHKFNKTIYELINMANITSKLAAIVNDDPELVKMLNDTSANYTLFAPIDEAFKRIPPKAPKPPKEILNKVISYHVAPGMYPVPRIIHSNTIPSVLKPDTLNGEQRLAVSLGHGLRLNFYAKIIPVNIHATNGIIHGVKAILVPPPPTLAVIERLPTVFSTLTLGLEKTGLIDSLKMSTHVGSTFFAPTNEAFKKLGPRLNAFLFSKPGEKYLKALLEYHIVQNQTLYADAFYGDADATPLPGKHHKKPEKPLPAPPFDHKEPHDGPHPPPPPPPPFDHKEPHDGPHPPPPPPPPFGHKELRHEPYQPHLSYHYDEEPEEPHVQKHDMDNAVIEAVSSNRVDTYLSLSSSSDTYEEDFYERIHSLFGKGMAKLFGKNHKKGPHGKPGPKNMRYELPTLLSKNVTVDVFHFGPHASMFVNHKVPVVFIDGVTRDGVLQVVHNLILPPKPGKDESEFMEESEVSDLSVEEFKALFDSTAEEPFNSASHKGQVKFEL